MSARQLPALTDEERINLEEKQLTNVLAKVNSGQVLTEREEAIANAAHARFKTLTAAPSLFLQTTELGFEVAVTKELESRGINDASRLIEQKPEVFRVIANLLARQTPIRDICAICGVSGHTVQSVADHPEAKLPVATQKAHLMAKMRLAVSLGIEGIIERFSADPGSITALEWAIIKDKLAVDEGGVTDRTELIITDDDTKEFMALVKQARARPGMVMDAEEVSPKAAPRALPPPSFPSLGEVMVSVLKTDRLTRDTQCTEDDPPTE